MEKIIKLLNQECDYTLPERIWLDFLSMGTEIFLRKNDTLIAPGQIDRNVYIIKEGVMRGVDFDGDRERTTCFGFPGTMFNSRYSFYKNLPSYYHIMSCNNSVLLRIPFEKYIAFTENNHEFAVWALHYAWMEQFLIEYREATMLNGTAEERYVKILKHRPALETEIPNSILASYICVTPEHLCRIKAKLLRERKI